MAVQSIHFEYECAPYSTTDEYYCAIVSSDLQFEFRYDGASPGANGDDAKP